jgi:hypothetical protein
MAAGGEATICIVKASLGSIKRVALPVSRLDQVGVRKRLGSQDGGPTSPYGAEESKGARLMPQI